jgi:hypothetical protein
MSSRALAIGENVNGYQNEVADYASAKDHGKTPSDDLGESNEGTDGGLLSKRQNPICLFRVMRHPPPDPSENRSNHTGYGVNDGHLHSIILKAA